MKKYLAAGGVAVVAFAFAASAASLTVEADTLQVGQTAAGELECADSATVVAWDYDSANAGSEVDGATVALASGHTCDGETLHLTLLDASDDALTTGTVVLDGTETAEVVFTATAAEDVEGVRIGIVQE